MTPASLENSHEVFFYDAVYPTIAIAHFLHQGLTAGESAFVVATAEHISQIEGEVESLGGSIRDNEAAGTWSVLNADSVAILMRTDFENELWQTLIGESVSDAIENAANGRVRLYGELADALVRDGNPALAISLEALTNFMVAERPVRVLCGYSKHTFPDPAMARDLTRACLLHDSIRADLQHPEDWRVKLISTAAKEKRH